MTRRTLLIQKIDFKFFCCPSSKFFQRQLSVRIRSFERAYLEGFPAFQAYAAGVKIFYMKAVAIYDGNRSH